jgi:hypothetical protein
MSTLHTIIQLTKEQWLFLDKITTNHRDWFIYNFAELTLSQIRQIMETNYYTNLDQSLLNHIRERYINDFTI